MSRLITLLLCMGLLVACMLGTTLSLPLQSLTLILIGCAGLLGMGVVRQGVYHMWTLAPVMVAIGYFVWRASVSPVQDLAMEDLFLILASGSLYLLVGYAVDSPRTRVWIAGVILMILCGHLGSAILQITGQSGYSMVGLFAEGAARPWAPSSEPGMRVTGMFGYEGSFANFAIIAGLLSLCLGVWGRFSKWLRISLCLLAALAIVCAALAQSRSAMLGLVAGMAVMLVLLWISVGGQRDKLRGKLRGAILVLGCLGMVLGAMGATWVFVNQAPEAEASGLTFSSNVRLGYWPMAVEQFVDHPLIGAGSRSFSYECFQYWNPTLATHEANPEFVHNEYLQTLADYGIIGFILVLVVLGIHLGLGARRISTLAQRITEGGFAKGSNAMALALAGVVGMVVMLVHVIFDFRTHSLANLLIFVCCTAWVLPVRAGRSSSGAIVGGRLFPWVMGLVLVAMGCLSIGLGVYHLRGGMPLLKNRMATEAGLWSPQSVSRSVWIPALEESVKKAPTYRRHLKLGALYSIEAGTMKGETRQKMLRKAINQYERAAERHPYEPVSQLNLAQLYGYLGEYEKADKFFQNADHLGSARSFWFKIHLKWGEMLRSRAGTLWRKGNKKEAVVQYQRAVEFLEPLEISREEQGTAYVRVIIEYGALLDSLENYDESSELLERAKLKLPNSIVHSLRYKFIREMGDHYLRDAKFLWYKRQPEQAWQALLKAKENYYMHHVLLKGREDKQAEKSREEVKQIMMFFKKTGVGGNE